MSSWALLAGIALATLASEDLTSVGVGLLVRDGGVSPLAGMAALAFGIYFGDLGLWAAGRVGGRRLLAHRWMAGRLSAAKVDATGAWLDRHLPAAILASRFLPGTRLPLYVGAGIASRRPVAFAVWTLISVVLWVPAIVLGTARGGATLLEPLERIVGVWPARLLLALAVFGALRLAGRLATHDGRRRLSASLARLWRWEFWPPWAFYAPVAAWVALLVLRHRGAAPIAAANPAIPDGGFVGESKYDILRLLPADCALPAFRVAAADADARAAHVAQELDARGWSYPLVFKPDVGERGAGVTLVRDAAAARALLAARRDALVVQQYHPGPFEAGVFYYRLPDEPRGRIFSITDKHFPAVTGDGRRTLETLVWDDERLRMQARIFLARLGEDAARVPGAGERVALGFAGNHAQGACFRDGAHLVTPALEARIDAIARQIPGFYIGRFDVRYADVERFRAGEDLGIVELNGVTSESTNVYDPSWTLLRAWRTLFRQWSLVFSIGARNLATGHVCDGRRIVQLAAAHVFPPLRQRAHGA